MQDLSHAWACRDLLEKDMGYVYRENGKENGNYYLRFRVQGLGLKIGESFAARIWLQISWEPGKQIINTKKRVNGVLALLS